MPGELKLVSIGSGLIIPPPLFHCSLALPTAAAAAAAQSAIVRRLCEKKMNRSTIGGQRKTAAKEEIPKYEL
jgi:hypothetical protein